MCTGHRNGGVALVISLAVEDGQLINLNGKHSPTVQKAEKEGNPLARILSFALQGPINPLHYFRG